MSAQRDMKSGYLERFLNCILIAKSSFIVPFLLHLVLLSWCNVFSFLIDLSRDVINDLFFPPVCFVSSTLVVLVFHIRYFH